MSQTHILNFFPGSIHSSRILKTLSFFASRQKNTYLPNQQVWLNKLCFQISNSKEKKCLTIDTREVNELGPGKFRTSADDGEEQTKATHILHRFFAKRIRNDSSEITFSIVKVNSDFNLVNKSLDIELNSSLSDGRAKTQFQQISRADLNNGRSKTDNFTESTTVRQWQQGGQYSNDNRKLDRGSARKESRFLSVN